MSAISPCQARPEEFVELKYYLRTLQESWILTFARTLFGITGAAGGANATRPTHRASTQVDVSAQVAGGATPRDSIQATSFAHQSVTSHVTGLRPGKKLDEELIDKRKTGEQRIHPEFSDAKIAQCNPYYLDEDVLSVRHVIERLDLLDLPWKNPITT